MNTAFESQLDSRVDDASDRMELSGVGMAARACVVNRTHRVVRQRAQVMQARRSRMRELMVPLILCSALLLWTAFGIWGGWYQNPSSAAAAVQTDVAALAASDAINHYFVALLWFVPACLAVLATVLYRRARENANGKAGR
jgi:hypothetical protein